MHHQCGISAIIPQRSFHGETSAEAKKNVGCFLRLGGVKTEMITTLGRFKYDSNGNKNIKKLKQLCTCITHFTISLPPQRLQQEIPSFHVYGGNKARKRFSVPFRKLAN